MLVVNAIYIIVFSFNVYHVILSVTFDHRLLLIGSLLLHLYAILMHEIVLQAFVLITIGRDHVGLAPIGKSSMGAKPT